MIVFAFTTLAFALFGAALFFAYRLVKLQAMTAAKEQRRRSIHQRRAINAKIQAVENRLNEISLQTRKDKTTSPAMPTNLFSRMEDRHLKELNTVISVGDTPVPIG